MRNLKLHKPAFFILLSLLANCRIEAQTINGRVKDSGDKYLPLVNVLLLKEDSSVVKGSATDDQGKFNFQKVSPGQYLLRISSVGFQTINTAPFKIVSGQQEIQIPVITLSSGTAQLNDVTVTGKRPFLEQKIDRTVVNVANSIVASGSTVLEVLEKSPGITIDRQNDQISLRGKEGVLVQIDGKQSYLPMTEVVALLKTMPSDNVDRIEIITNPSAKYDAAGNSGIIDIRLKKNNNIGTNGNATAAAGFGVYLRERGSLQLNHREKKMNVFGNLSGNSFNQLVDFDIRRNQPDGNLRNLVNSLSIIRVKNRSANSKAGIDFFLNNSTTLGIVWTGIWSSNSEKSPAHALFRRSENQEPYLHTLTDKRIRQNASNQLGNINFVHSFKKNQAQISTDLDLGRFSKKFENLLSTETLFPSNPANPLYDMDSRMPTTIDILTFRIDYSQAIKKWKFETGVKIGSVGSDNNLEIFSGDRGKLQKDSVLSNHFKYQENIFAAYFTLAGKLNKTTDLLFGLRAENTHSDGRSINLNTRVKRKYLNIFPSIFVSRQLDKNNVFTGSYSYRIDRPNYQNLNPGRGYLDAYTYSAGNPYLNPQYTHAFELKHVYKSKLFTSVGASFISDYVYFVVQPIDSKLGERKPFNIGLAQVYNITVSYPLTIVKGWTMQNTLMSNYSRFQYDYKGTLLHFQAFSGRLTSSNIFTLNKTWTAELGGWLTPPRINGIERIPWLGSLDAGIQKVFNQKLKSKLSIQDIFFTNIARGDINLSDYSTYARIAFDSRVVMLNFTYTFGNQQLKSSRQRKTGSEEETQRSN